MISEQAENLRRIGSIVLAFALMLAVNVIFPPAEIFADSVCVDDQSGLFTSDEREELASQCEAFREETGCTIFILTAGEDQVGSSSDSATRQYIEEYGDTNFDGSSIGMIIRADTGYYYIDVSGSDAISSFTSDRQEQISGNVHSCLSDEDWYGAAQAFVDSAEDAWTGSPDEETTGNRALEILIAAAAAAVVAGIMTSAQVRKHHEKRTAVSAEPYVVAGTTKYSVRRDNFVTEYVTRVPKPKPQQNGGNGPHPTGGGPQHSGTGGHF